MFTGLIEEVGIVKSISKGTKSARITIQAEHILENVRLGDSIATNGVCLTVTDFSSGLFSVDVMAATMGATNLNNLVSGDKVNLERALRVGDRLGGHLVSGHVDGIGIIKDFEKEDNAVWVSIKPPAELLKYIIHKGSITIDGISLTVSYLDDSIFKVSIIPHTKDATTLLSKNVGDKINLECDMIGKYIERFLTFKEPKSESNMDLNFLSKHGFI